MRRYRVEDDRVQFFELLAASFTGEATPVQLYQLELLLEADAAMQYEMQLLREMWFQEPETDPAAMQLVWEKIVAKILFYNKNDYMI